MTKVDPVKKVDKVKVSFFFVDNRQFSSSRLPSHALLIHPLFYLKKEARKAFALRAVVDNSRS